ncbi:Protein kinase, membrane associated tyrosine threonine 1 [Nowakowskiella sp. JEL0078]|nr:Protein kinase, membrane associated tyrosine threonine 1 [Nowakowskiella sp. JEL0078]
MGGNAFPDTKRINKVEFERLSNIVKKALHFLGVIVCHPAELSDKEDFGDIDFYIAFPKDCADKQSLTENLIKTIVDTIASTIDPVIHGQTHSFLSQERYQVDVYFCKDVDVLPICASVSANGDFVWLLQKSLEKHALLLSKDGLYLREYLFADAGLISKRDGKFLLSIDPLSIAEFVGIPWSTFDGETTLSSEEVFETVSSSRFFSPIALESWNLKENSSERRRRVKRPLVGKYLEWWEQTGRQKYSITPALDVDVRKEAVEFFGVVEKYRDFVENRNVKIQEAAFRAECKNFINGDLIKEWCPGLKGPEIGQLMQIMREKHGTDWESYKRWLTESGKDEIRKSAIICADLKFFKQTRVIVSSMSSSKKHSSISYSYDGPNNKTQPARPSFISSKSDTSFAYSKSEHSTCDSLYPPDDDNVELKHKQDFSNFCNKEIQHKIQKSPLKNFLTKKKIDLSQSATSVNTELKGDKAKIFLTPSSIPIPVALKKKKKTGGSNIVESDAGSNIVPSNREDVLADNFSKLSTTASNEHHINLPESFSDSIFAFPPSLSLLSPLKTKSPTFGIGGRRVFSHLSPDVRSITKIPRNSVIGDNSSFTSIFTTPQRTATPFFTPQPNLVKPTPEAFQAHSTGFLSKKSRSLKPLIFAPDTPLKKKDQLIAFTFNGTPESQKSSTTFSSENKNESVFDPSPPTPTRSITQSRPKKPRSPSRSPSKPNKRPLLMTSPSRGNIFQKTKTSLVIQQRLCPLSPKHDCTVFHNSNDADRLPTVNAAKKLRFQELLQQQQLKDQKLKLTLKVPSHNDPANLMAWNDGSKSIQTEKMDSLNSQMNQEMEEPSIKPHLNLMNSHMRELTAEYCETEENLIDADYFEFNFRIVTKIGEGSFGFVFKVINKLDGKLYAIKRARKAYTGYKDRMKKLQEVRLMWKIGIFPQCVRLISAWEQSGFMFMQMELCEGGSLQAYFDKTEEQMDNWNYWKILMEIAKGIEHIHSSNILHLDLKPANILIGDNWNLKISDFGVATYCDLAYSADLEGDRTYIAPEILRSEYGKPADIFSLGLMILEISQNVVLPENGIDWQRLRVCDLSDFEFEGPVLEPLGELIKSMLQPEPKARPSASEILRHPCIRSLEISS